LLALVNRIRIPLVYIPVRVHHAIRNGCPVIVVQLIVRQKREPFDERLDIILEYSVTEDQMLLRLIH
jgi:hypothetical protein